MLIGKAPLQVTFTDTSTPPSDITYWHWDFGDGDTSEEQNPVHLYANVGTYTVTLNIASGKGIDTYTDTVQVTGLIAQWRLDEASGTRVDIISGLDLSEDGGTVVSATGKFGDAASLVAAESRCLYVDYDPDFQDVSVSAWAKIGAAGAFNAIFSITSYWSDYTTISIYKAGAEIRALIGDGTVDNEYATAAWPGADWHHFVAVYDHSTKKVSLYVDGAAAVLSDALAGTLQQAADSRIVIGATWQAAGVQAFDNFWDGEIDDVRLYNAALDADEVAALYALGGP